MQGELFRIERRGGRRKNAGRKPSGPRAGQPHVRREEVRAYWPVHVTLRVGRDVPYLRKRNIWRAIAKATVAASKKLRIVHASVQHDHLHLVVEAEDTRALSAGITAFQVSAAHWINQTVGRKGCVFPDRFHTHVLKTLREARNAVAYVLTNWRKHGEDVHARCMIDPFSTGHTVWHSRVPQTMESLATAPPGTWMLQNIGEISPYVRCAGS